MSLSLGIDVSTTAVKAVVIDENGSVVASASTPLSLQTPRPLWAEQSPEDWWQATCASVRQAMARLDNDRLQAIGVTGQMHGLVLLDEDLEVLRPAILWNDQRAAAQCDAIRQRLGQSQLVRLTGNDAFPGFSAPKLLWVREHEPKIYARVRHVLLPKDYVRLRLTSEPATDRAGAGGTLLLGLESRDWSPAVLEALEIPPEWLPPTHEGTQITGFVSADGAEACGLRPGLPVVGGGGDQAAQAVGVGAVEPGVVALTLGTSGVVFATSDRPLVDPRGRLHAFPHAVPGRWHVMGVMLSAAGSLRWYRDVMAPDSDFDQLLADAEGVPRGADGLVFLPYLSGERTPHADPHLRASFLGLTLHHGRGHLTRAVLEGVAFGLRDNLALMRDVGLDDTGEIRISGGGARSPLWRRILADVLGTRLVSVRNDEGAAFGAALLAATGAGCWTSVAEACRQAITFDDVTAPDADGVAGYQPLYERFTRAYPMVRPLYGEHGQATDFSPTA